MSASERRHPVDDRGRDEHRPEPVTGRRRDVLAMLQASTEPLSIVEIAERLDVHPNTVRFHLEALSNSGRVERAEPPRISPGRPPLLFRARRGMDPSGRRNYRLLAGILAASVAADANPVARVIEAGHAWGGHLVNASPSSPELTEDGAVGRLVGLLDDLGFMPQQRSTGGHRQIGLRHCPFLELIDSQASIVCPAHLGLMQGAMTALGSSVTVERLDPFVEPDLCLAHLGHTSAATAPPDHTRSEVQEARE